MESTQTFEYRTPAVEWGSYEDEYDELDEPMFLENPWTVWYDQYPGPGLTAQQYAAAMKKVAQIESVQDFWGIFNNLPALEEIHTKSSYHLMKNVTLPLWEDNVDGGSLTFRIKKTDSQHVWLYMVLAVIGEQFDDVLTAGDEIQGISVNVRAGTEDAVTLWNKRADLINVNKFQEKIKKLLFGVDFLSEVTYRVHRAELTFNSGSHKSHKSKKGNSSPPRGNSPPKKAPRGTSPPKHNNHHNNHSNYTPKAKSPKKSPNPHSKSPFVKNISYVYVPISV